MRAPSLRGLRTITRGRVADVRQEGEEIVADVEVWTETEEGTVLTPGTATVSLPSG